MSSTESTGLDRYFEDRNQNWTQEQHSQHVRPPQPPPPPPPPENSISVNRMAGKETDLSCSDAKPVRRLKISHDTTEKVNTYLHKRQLVVNAAVTKIINIKEDFTDDTVRHAFENAHLDQLLMMLEYGIDVFSPFCQRRRGGEESWVIDFYGRYSTAFTRDLIQDQKLILLREHRRQKWKISLIGGSVRRWNGRRHFIAFLERYVVNPKFDDLKESTRRVFSIATVQSAVVSYM